MAQAEYAVTFTVVHRGRIRRGLAYVAAFGSVALRKLAFRLLMPRIVRD